MKRDELIEELKKLPTNSEVVIMADIKDCGEIVECQIESVDNCPRMQINAYER